MSARTKTTARMTASKPYVSIDDELIQGWTQFCTDQREVLEDYAQEHPKLKKAIRASIKIDKTVLWNEDDEKSFANNLKHGPQYTTTGVKGYSKTHFWSRDLRFPPKSIAINGIFGCFHKSWQKVSSLCDLCFHIGLLVSHILLFFSLA